MGWAARLNKAGVMPKRQAKPKIYQADPIPAAPKSKKLGAMLFMAQIGMLSAYQRGKIWTQKW